MRDARCAIGPFAIGVAHGTNYSLDSALTLADDEGGRQGAVARAEPARTNCDNQATTSNGALAAS